MILTTDTSHIEHDDPISSIEDIQIIVRKEIRDKIFGTVRHARWKSMLDINACVVLCLLYLINTNSLTEIYDLNDELIELSHEYYDKIFGEDLVDSLLTLSIRDMIRQEAVKIWGEIGPKPGERRWRQSKKR